MYKLRRSGSDGQLPFFAPSVQSHKTFKLFRFWRSLPRFQRTLMLALSILALTGLLYVFTVRSTSEVERDLHLEELNRPNQVAFPPEAQKVDGGGQNLNNVIADFDQVEEAKQQAAQADAAQQNAVAANGPVEGNLAAPRYPRFKGPQNERQRAVVNGFRHAWTGYKKYAWGHDHLRPISKTYSEWFGTGLSIVDALDTMIIMGLDNEFEEARAWVADSLNFDRSVFVSFFEATIRMLGGLLSAFHLTGDNMFVDRAADLGGRLAAAFNTSSAVPFSDVNLKSRSGRQPSWGSESSLSEVTTVQLEFRDLSRVTNNATFEKLSFGTSEHVHKVGCARHDGLCEMYISPNSGKFRESSTITVGARSDSYYEYLLKQWLQTGKTINWLRDDYNQSIASMEKHLIRQSEPNNITFVGELIGGTSYSPKMDHLVCFLAGSLALGAVNGLPASHLDLGKAIGQGCHRMYQTATGLWPEIIYFNLQPGQGEDINIKEADAHCLLRPEAIEAWFYLYRATGDKMYQEWGWNAFEALEKYAKVENGYSSVNNVKRTPVSYRDLMESFLLSETFKYLYLLLADDQSEIPLNKYVFNTEGHPLPIYDH